MSNEQIKDIIIALIEHGHMNSYPFDEAIEHIIKAYNELSSRC